MPALGLLPVLFKLIGAAFKLFNPLVTASEPNFSVAYISIALTFRLLLNYSKSTVLPAGHQRAC